MPLQDLKLKLTCLIALFVFCVSLFFGTQSKHWCLQVPRGAGDRSSTLPIQVPFIIIFHLLQRRFLDLYKILTFLPQGNRVSIGSTEGDSLDGVSANHLLFHFPNKFV